MMVRYDNVGSASQRSLNIDDKNGNKSKITPPSFENMQRKLLKHSFIIVIFALAVTAAAIFYLSHSHQKEIAKLKKEFDSIHRQASIRDAAAIFAINNNIAKFDRNFYIVKEDVRKDIVNGFGDVVFLNNLGSIKCLNLLKKGDNFQLSEISKYASYKDEYRFTYESMLYASTIMAKPDFDDEFFINYVNEHVHFNSVQFFNDFQTATSSAKTHASTIKFKLAFVYYHAFVEFYSSSSSVEVKQMIANNCIEYMMYYMRKEIF